MATDIQSGQPIKITITGCPKAASQRKTLTQICEKDKTVQLERRRLRQARPIDWRRRAGRLWGGRSSRIPVIQLVPDATYTVFGSVEVLRQLKSVEKFVKITPT